MSATLPLIAARAIANAEGLQALTSDQPDAISRRISECAATVADLNAYGESVKRPVDTAERELYIATGLLLQVNERFARYLQYADDGKRAQRWRRAVTCLCAMIDEAGRGVA